MENMYFKDMPKFSSPEEELNYLREHVKRREEEIKGAENIPNKEAIARETISAYKMVPAEKVLPTEQMIPTPATNEIVLRLKPENHDTQMEGLLSIMLEKGLKNALTVLEKMKSPHLDDDFHRLLVQYLYSKNELPGLKEGNPLALALHMKLFEITLPDKDKDDTRTFKDMMSAMEQFYSGMQSVADGRDMHGKHYFTLEIALSNASDQVIFYAGVPSTKADLFEKQLLSAFPTAKVNEVADDYNIFTDGGAAVGANASLTANEIFPLKTYETIDHDPMNSILNVFSKMKREGEGAAIQFIISPEGDAWITKFNTILKEVQKGESVKKAGELLQWGGAMKHIGKELFFGAPKPKETEKKVDDIAVKHITDKLKATIVPIGIRVIASAETLERANAILGELESAFNQFSEPGSNSIEFKKIKNSDSTNLFHDYSYRLRDADILMPLNFKELTTMMHFPWGIGSAPQLKVAKSAGAPAPSDIGGDGILLGTNSYRGVETQVAMAREDRLRHFYVIGQTGTGKTSLLKNMIVQDIKNGDGVCFIDPHGSDIEDIMSQIPKERIDDVIYFDPAYTARPMGLNMLEYDVRYAEQKTFVVNEMMSIFNKLFDMKTAGGPMFEQYFRNAVLLVLDDPDSGSTLIDVARVLSDENFRKMKLSKCTNPIVVQFWTGIAGKAGGEASLANIVPYITSKFDVFLSNDIMRPIIAAEKSVFNFRKVMDEKKILLVNLSKGRLGEINANLIGLILVGKIQMAALSRVDMPAEQRNDFYLYIDEFQNVTTDSIASILSEARKYKLSLNIAHQYIAQLQENIKDAVFGNVGSMAVFRVSADDADYLQTQFAPTFTSADIMKLDNYNAYIKMLVHGVPAKPFNMVLYPPTKGNKEIVEKLKELSYLKFGRPRADVEREIMARYQNN